MDTRQLSVEQQPSTLFKFLGIIGSLLADVAGAFFYVYVGGKVTAEMEWLMDVWFFLPGLAVIGLVVGPRLGTRAALLSEKLNSRTLSKNVLAFLGGAIPIALVWLLLFIKIWIESAYFFLES